MGTDRMAHPLVFTGVPLTGDQKTGGTKLVVEYKVSSEAHWGQRKLTMPAPIDVMPMPG